jgi:CRISPR type IV-associated protein Csf2
MTMTRHSILLEIITRSPMHITALNGGRYLPDRNQINRWSGGANEPGIPCQLTRTLKVRKANASPRPLATNEDAPSTSAVPRSDFVDVPVIPANSLGGKLRSAAASLIEDALIARGLTLSAAAYNTQRKGASSATIERDKQTVTLAVAGANHPFYGLFGGTAFGISANLVVHDGYPVTPDTVPLLISPPRVIEPANGALTSAIPIVRKDALLAMEDTERLQAIVGLDIVNKYHAAELQRSLDKRANQANEGAEKGKKTSLRAIAATEAINPGTGFQLAFDVTTRNDAQLGLLLLALHRVINDGQIGGKRARGFGQFRVVASRMRSQDSFGEGVLFSPANDEGAYAFVGQEEISRALAAAESWLESVDVADLEAFASDEAPTYFKAAV